MWQQLRRKQPGNHFLVRAGISVCCPCTHCEASPLKLLNVLLAGHENYRFPLSLRINVQSWMPTFWRHLKKIHQSAAGTTEQLFCLYSRGWHTSSMSFLSLKECTQTKKIICRLVSSKEQRPLFFSVISRRSTIYLQSVTSRFFFSIGLNIISLVSASGWKNVQFQRGWFGKRKILLASSPAWTCVAAPPCALTRAASNMRGFFNSKGFQLSTMTFCTFINYLQGGPNVVEIACIVAISKCAFYVDTEIIKRFFWVFLWTPSCLASSKNMILRFSFSFWRCSCNDKKLLFQLHGFGFSKQNQWFASPTIFNAIEISDQTIKFGPPVLIDPCLTSVTTVYISCQPPDQGTPSNQFAQKTIAFLLTGKSNTMFWTILRGQQEGDPKETYRGTNPHLITGFVTRTKAALPSLPEMACMKRVNQMKRRRSTDQQPGTKSGHCPAIQPLIVFNSRTCLAWKGLTETNKRRYTGQQPATKSARGPVDKPRINRG